MEFLTGITKPYAPASTSWDNSPIEKIILKLPNGFIINNIATITLGTCHYFLFYYILR